MRNAAATATANSTPATLGLPSRKPDKGGTATPPYPPCPRGHRPGARATSSAARVSLSQDHQSRHPRKMPLVTRHERHPEREGRGSNPQVVRADQQPVEIGRAHV